MNRNKQDESSDNPKQKRSSVKETKHGIFRKLNKFVGNMCEVRRNGNAHIEEKKNLFHNNPDKLGENSGKQKALNTKQNDNFEDLQRPNKIVKTELKKEGDDNLSFKRKRYVPSSTDNDCNKSLPDYMKIQRNYEVQKSQSKLQIEFLNNENSTLKKNLATCSVQIDNLKKDVHELTKQNKKLQERYEYEYDYNAREIESLKAVLEMKKKEVVDLEKSIHQLTEEVEAHAADKKKISILQAKCDDLQFQLQSRKKYETMLKVENEQLEFSIREETRRRENLSFRNDELEWKLRMFEDSLDDKNGKPVGSLDGSSLNCKRTRNDLNEITVYPTLEEPHLTSKQKCSLVLKVSNIVDKPKSVSYFVKIIEWPFELVSASGEIRSRHQ